VNVWAMAGDKPARSAAASDHLAADILIVNYPSTDVEWR
jgi:hypothetical protein